jgi:hypothetical protein
MTTRALARRELGAAAVLSEAEAVRLLPCRDSTARRWLRDRGLVRSTPIGEVVVWGDVVAALVDAPKEEPPRPRSRLPVADDLREKARARRTK